MANHAKITGFRFALIYSEDVAISQAFYEKYFGFEQTAQFSETEVYGNLGQVEVWIGGGYERSSNHEKSSRATMMLGVDSVGALLKQLKADGVKTVQDEPVEMQAGTFWLQFHDPAGNALEVLGEE
jgi:predicted enzyme related to lactoylglutathione lyase